MSLKELTTYPYRKSVSDALVGDVAPEQRDRYYIGGGSGGGHAPDVPGCACCPGNRRDDDDDDDDEDDDGGDDIGLQQRAAAAAEREPQREQGLLQHVHRAIQQGKDKVSGWAVGEHNAQDIQLLGPQLFFCLLFCPARSIRDETMYASTPVFFWAVSRVSMFSTALGITGFEKNPLSKRRPRYELCSSRIPQPNRPGDTHLKSPLSSLHWKLLSGSKLK